MPRWNRRGTQQVWFVPTIVSVVAPTTAEIAAGKRLDTVMRALTGFKTAGSDLDVADASSTFPKTIAGPDTVDASSMTMYDGDTAGDAERLVQTALAKGTNGYVVFIPEGAPVALKRARVWPIRVNANDDDQSGDNVGATYTVGYSHPTTPTLNAVLA